MTARRFRDVVAWDALVAPGVVVQKDGSLLSGWRVRGIDTGRLSPAEHQALRVEFARGVSTLAGGETLWLIWQRRPWTPQTLLAETGHDALDALALEANGLLAEPGQLWEDRCTLWLHRTTEGAEGTLETSLEALNVRRTLLEGWWDPIVGLTRMDGQKTPAGAAPPAQIVCDLADLTQTPRVEPRLAELPVALDALIAPELHQPSLSGPVLCSGRAVAVLTVSGEREDYAPCPLDSLQDLPRAFTWVTRYRGLSRSQARNVLFWRRKQLRQSAADLVANVEGSASGDRSTYADQLVAETEITRAAIERGADGHGTFLSVLLVAEDAPARLPASIQTLREAVQRTGFHLRHEGAGAVATYLATLPGHAIDIPREVMVRAQVLADCAPVRRLAPGSPVCPSPLLPPDTPALLPAIASDGTLHTFNLHVDDVGHTLIFGPTGTGKSVLLGHLIAAWLRYPDAQVIAFDRGRSLRYLTAALGGLWLEPGTSAADAAADAAPSRTTQAGGVAPLSHIERLGSTWALDWVSELIRRSQGHTPSPEEMRDLGMAVNHVRSSAHPGLAVLRDMVQTKALRNILDTWIVGPRAGLFDPENALDVGGALHRSASHATAPLTVFETEPLIDAHEDVTVLTLDYLFAEVATRFDGRPTFIVIDEAWKLLAHAIFAERLKSWLKEGRKKNVAVLMATQSVSDAARAAITADLVESCPTRLYLANSMATTSTQAPDYQALGLSPDRIATVAALRRKRQMLMIQADTARVLAMPLGPYALSILGRTSTTESRTVPERVAADPDFWKADLMAQARPEHRNSGPMDPPRHAAE